MRLRRGAVAAAFVAIAAFTSLAPQAVAAPMPWETSNIPTATIYDVTFPAVGDSGTVTALCDPPCCQ